MKTIRIALLGLMLSAGLVSGAYADGPRVSISLGYPVYAAPPPVYYTPPPPVYYVPPPRIYRRPPPPLVYAPPYGYAGYSYGYDYGRRGGPYNHRHHHH
ncbi:hypothetical protein AT959_20175 [Dechloromonas denitrificans]|uniref:Virulence factor n=1 Tax=Dechloromonas denitrificans TaxID=281362 RepID=A0A133XDW4_9RHOO|nr:hypothetical protein [Dechloromonas denitrificans]KXB29128.1 hypothetical protein AT959_20175 [Dechloromonas denitrificans]